MDYIVTDPTVCLFPLLSWCVMLSVLMGFGDHMQAGKCPMKKRYFLLISEEELFPDDPKLLPQDQFTYP